MIDEIYDLFVWDASLTPAEYETRIEKGLQLAAQVRHLFPFLQPILPRATKSHWDPCARVLAARSDAELDVYLYPLFEWLQDMNWPGADILYARLLRFPFSKLEPIHTVAVTEALRSNDEIWLENLEHFRKDAVK